LFVFTHPKRFIYIDEIGISWQNVQVVVEVGNVATVEERVKSKMFFRAIGVADAMEQVYALLAAALVRYNMTL